MDFSGNSLLIADFYVWRFCFFYRKQGVITNGEAIVMAVKETLRYGLFLGTFAGTFVSVDEIVGSLLGHRRHVLSPFVSF